MPVRTEPLDRIERRILAELQRDGRVSLVALARRVGLTKTPLAERVRKLERAGYIRGYAALLDPDKLGAGHVALVQVTLERTTTDVLDAFNAAVREIPQVQSCHMVAGAFDYLLKVRSRDIAEYRALLGTALSALPGVQQTHTFAVMETVKDEPFVAVEEPTGPHRHAAH